MGSTFKDLGVKIVLLLSTILVTGVAAAQNETQARSFEMRPRHVYFFGSEGIVRNAALQVGNRLCEQRGFDHIVDWKESRLLETDIENPGKLRSFQIFEQDGKKFVRLTSFDEVLKQTSRDEDRIAVLFQSITCERKASRNAAIEDEIFQADPADIDLDSVGPRLSEQTIEEL